MAAVLSDGQTDRQTDRQQPTMAPVRQQGADFLEVIFDHVGAFSDSANEAQARFLADVAVAAGDEFVDLAREI
jgi:hypothetical protein